MNMSSSDSYSEVKSIYSTEIPQGLNTIDEHAIERTKTEQTIVSVLSHRANRVATLPDNPINDVENRLAENEEDAEEFYEKEEAELPTKNDGSEFKNIDKDLVTWDGEDDPEHPRNWSPRKKWTTLMITSSYALLSPFASSMASPSAEFISKDFGYSSPILSAMISSIFILAYAIVPLFVSPLSEKYGRKHVLNISLWVLVAFTIGCSFSQNMASIIIFRFLAGAGGSTPLCVGTGVVGDLFNNKDRGLANSIFNLGPTTGPALAPLIAGFVQENLGWRWNFRLLTILSGVVTIAGTLFLEETYSPVLLKSKCKRLQKETGNKNLRTIFDIADGSTAWERFVVSFTLPFKFLFEHPMIYGLGVFQAFLYGLYYLLIIAFPSVFGDVYHFNIGIQGLMFLSFAIGYVFGFMLWPKLNQKLYLKRVSENNGVSEPEFRIETLMPTAIICSIAILIFGWTAEKGVHWIVPAIFAAFYSMSYLNNFFTITVYIIDMNPRFAASALSGLSFFRSMFGFVFPLFSPKMFQNLGYGWSCTIFFFLMLALGIPFPLFVWSKGKNLRLWANRRFEKSQAKRDAKYLARLEKKNQKTLEKSLSEKA